jgi:hypothetical protein
LISSGSSVWKSGTMDIILNGSAQQDITMTGTAVFPLSSLTLNNAAGAKLTTNVDLLEQNGNRPDLLLTNGTLDLNSFNLDGIKEITDVTGNIVKSGGSLDYINCIGSASPGGHVNYPATGF